MTDPSQLVRERLEQLLSEADHPAGHRYQSAGAVTARSASAPLRRPATREPSLPR
jgi:hypothetical protein